MNYPDKWNGIGRFLFTEKVAPDNTPLFKGAPDLAQALDKHLPRNARNTIVSCLAYYLGEIKRSYARPMTKPYLRAIERVLRVCAQSRGLDRKLEDDLVKRLYQVNERVNEERKVFIRSTDLALIDQDKILKYLAHKKPHTHNIVRRSTALKREMTRTAQEILANNNFKPIEISYLINDGDLFRSLLNDDPKLEQPPTRKGLLDFGLGSQAFESLREKPAVRLAFAHLLVSGKKGFEPVHKEMKCMAEEIMSRGVLAPLQYYYLNTRGDFFRSILNRDPQLLSLAMHKDIDKFGLTQPQANVIRKEPEVKLAFAQFLIPSL